MKSIRTLLVSIGGSAKAFWGRGLLALMVLNSELAFAQGAGSFTDRVGSAKARDSSTLLAGTKSGVDNYQTIFGMVLMLAGFAIFSWGVFWVMAAARSNGQKEAKAGWVMVAGGGVLGAATAVYLFAAGVFSSASS